MSYAKRMVQLPTSRVQHFVALSITATAAFTLGLAVSPFGHLALPATAPDQTRRAAVVAPPLAITGERYDGGFHVHLEDERAGEGREEPFLVGDIAITLRAPSYHDVLRESALRQWRATVDLGGPGSETSRPEA